MKISKSKQELARIISENGGWRDGAEWAAQDKDWRVSYFDGSEKPVRPAGKDKWWANGYIRLARIKAGKLLQFWHSAFISRSEYLHLYPAPDADGWIEWKGGACPVGDGVSVEVKRERFIEVVNNPEGINWVHYGTLGDIIAYRLHKSERSDAAYKFLDNALSELIAKTSEPLNMTEDEIKAAIDRMDDDVRISLNIQGDEARDAYAARNAMRRSPTPTIEQLMQIHCDRAHALGEKKAELLVAERQESEALDALKAACREAGFDISPVDKPQERQKPELVITDWRDLKVGDEIRCVGDWQDEETHGVIFSVDEIESPEYQYGLAIRVVLKNGAGAWGKDFEFIRRP